MRGCSHPPLYDDSFLSHECSRSPTAAEPRQNFASLRLPPQNDKLTTGVLNCFTGTSSLHEESSDCTDLIYISPKRPPPPILSSRTRLTPYRCSSIARSIVHTLRVPSAASKLARSASLPRPCKTICTQATPQSQRQHWLTCGAFDNKKRSMIWGGGGRLDCVRDDIFIGGHDRGRDRLCGLFHSDSFGTGRGPGGCMQHKLLTMQLLTTCGCAARHLPDRNHRVSINFEPIFPEPKHRTQKIDSYGSSRSLSILEQ